MILQEMNIAARNTFWQRIAISASGENRMDILHPSLASRIQKIERTLRTRNTAIDIETDEKLKELFVVDISALSRAAS